MFSAKSVYMGHGYIVRWGYKLILACYADVSYFTTLGENNVRLF